MTVDLLPETMRFVSIGEDGCFQLEFVFEVTCGLERFTLPVSVGGRSSIDAALAEATEKVRTLGLALARAARAADWAEVPVRTPAARARPCKADPPPFRLESPSEVMALAVAEPLPATAAASQCCDAI